MLPETTRTRIEQEAVPPDAPIHYSPPEAGMWSVGYEEGYIAGATTYAERVEKLERENAALKAEIHKMAETLESLI